MYRINGHPYSQLEERLPNTGRKLKVIMNKLATEHSMLCEAVKQASHETLTTQILCKKNELKDQQNHNRLRITPVIAGKPTQTVMRSMKLTK